MAAPTWNGRASFRRARGGRTKDAWGIDLDPKLNDTVKNLVERAYPRMGRLVEKELSRLLAKVKAKWPVGKIDQHAVHSIETIKLVYQIRGDLYRASLVVGANYAANISSGGVNIAKALILDEAEKLTDRLSELAAKEISKP